MSDPNQLIGTNVNNVRKQIESMQNSTRRHLPPFIATVQNAESVITDYDSFPYKRWYRGVAISTTPVIAEREAGFRTRHDQCYQSNIPVINTPNPGICFQPSCSTIFPCYQSTSKLHQDMEDAYQHINDVCIISNR